MLFGIRDENNVSWQVLFHFNWPEYVHFLDVFIKFVRFHRLNFLVGDGFFLFLKVYLDFVDFFFVGDGFSLHSKTIKSFVKEKSAA